MKRAFVLIFYVLIGLCQSGCTGSLSSDDYRQIIFTAIDTVIARYDGPSGINSHQPIQKIVLVRNPKFDSTNVNILLRKYSHSPFIKAIRFDPKAVEAVIDTTMGPKGKNKRLSVNTIDKLTGLPALELDISSIEITGFNTVRAVVAIEDGTINYHEGLQIEFRKTSNEWTVASINTIWGS